MIMIYKVIYGFTDLVDDGYVYNAGDTYPRAEYSPPEDRVLELISNRNRQKKPLIEQIQEKTEIKPKRVKRR